GVAMREIGIVTLLSVAVTAAAPGPQAYRPSVYVTPKSTLDFATCFARTQDQRGAAWWFVPRDKGGTFSNLGAKSGAATYFVVINDRGTRREIALDQRSPASGAREALNQCI
ncbi:MAG: hypothetical protein QOE50_894, partial [Sphingomonadales bacterium]|nr:hypothetical protein [Sphingomonadales bacterium]